MARPTLASRTALLTTAVAVVTVAIAGVLTYSLTRVKAEASARATLARLADVAKNGEAARNGEARNGTARNGGAARNGERRIGRLLVLRSVNISVAWFGPDGTPLPGSLGPARFALNAAEIRQVTGGVSLSTSRNTAGGAVLVEARPTVGGGAVVLAQRRADARGLATAMFRSTLLGLVVGLLVTVPAGIWLARRLARPLRHAAQAARAMATGRRDVQLAPEGPVEVADVVDSINTLAGALQYSEGRQRDFLLSISHELRTPLTAISGFAESLADGVTAGADVPAAGQTILAESRRMERLVTDLLDLARLGAADFRIDIAQVDLTVLMGSAAEVWRARCEAEGVPFRAELPAGPAPVATDPTRFRQIVDALAENALRVTPAGRPIVFGLYLEPPGGAGWHTAVLQVRDGGPGLTPDDCRVAFERSALYQRYRGVRQVGTGLGLALVHGLVTRLGGTAEVGRAPESGACFTIRIPRTSGMHQPTVPILMHPAAGTQATLASMSRDAQRTGSEGWRP